MMINPTEREFDLSKKLMKWMIAKGDDIVLRDDAPNKVKDEFEELKELRDKNNPAGWEW